MKAAQAREILSRISQEEGISVSLPSCLFFRGRDGEWKENRGLLTSGSKALCEKVLSELGHEITDFACPNSGVKGKLWLIPSRGGGAIRYQIIAPSPRG